jgi:hypothetical protein
MQQATGADALHGAILREFEVVPRNWAEACHGIAPLRGFSGPISMIEGSGNVLIARSCFAELTRPYFDPAFALTGGEDRDFFTRLNRAGKRFAWADDAVCYAFVPASRANLRWILQRAYRIGNSDMRVFLKYAPDFADRAKETAKIAGAILSFPLLAVAAFPSAETRLRPLCRLFRAFGKTAAVLGRHYNEYAVVHGD